MALRITAGSLFESRSLTVRKTDVVFLKTALAAGKRKFQFSEIDCVLLSTSGLLSFQVGNETFAIQTRADKPKHQEVVEALVRAVRETGTS